MAVVPGSLPVEHQESRRGAEVRAEWGSAISGS